MSWENRKRPHVSPRKLPDNEKGTLILTQGYFFCRLEINFHDLMNKDGSFHSVPAKVTAVIGSFWVYLFTIRNGYNSLPTLKGGIPSNLHRSPFASPKSVRCIKNKSQSSLPSVMLTQSPLTNFSARYFLFSSSKVIIR